jgi:hypothetical protein
MSIIPELFVAYPFGIFKLFLSNQISNRPRLWGLYIYNVNLGHAIIDYLLKLVGGKALRDKIGHVTYVIKMRLVMNSIMYYSTHLFTTIDDVYWILPI